MPRGRSLYGSLPDQLTEETSFVRQMQAILAVRKRSGVATARQVDVPDVSHRGLLVMVHLLDDDRTSVTVLNFADEQVDAFVRSEVGYARNDTRRGESAACAMDEPLVSAFYFLRARALMQVALVGHVELQVDLVELPLEHDDGALHDHLGLRAAAVGSGKVA